ncbi:MAG: P-type DNA transfer protein VirB5 [Candidatus Accumulibacter sp.]|jgi:type IV secretion system protein VirB5|nr:P-type DNA transfer protein VirB5 [Accumulibacter sp.]
MKTLFAALAAALALASPARAQIPVTDAAHIATQIANHAENILKFMEQIKQLQRTHDAMTGSRGLGRLLLDPRYRDYLPEDWRAQLETLRNGGGLGGDADALYRAARRFDACAFLKDSLQRTSCQARAMKGAVDRAMAENAYDKARQRVSQIEGLIGQIDLTADPKDIAELQARIAGEQALLQNEATKLQLYSMIADAEGRIQDQQQRELNARVWSARGGLKLKPLTFDE